MQEQPQRIAQRIADILQSVQERGGFRSRPGEPTAEEKVIHKYRSDLEHHPVVNGEDGLCSITSSDGV